MIICTPDLQVKFLTRVKQFKYTTEVNILELAKHLLTTEDIKTIPDLIESFTGNRKIDLISYLDIVGVNTAIEIAEKKGVVKTAPSISNVHSNFTTPNISTLFYTLHVASQYFRQSINNKIMSAVYIGDPKLKVYPNNNADLNKNINNLKNDLFKTIIDFLVAEGGFNKDDYYDGEIFKTNLFKNGIFNKQVYEKEYLKIIKAIEEKLLGKEDYIIYESTGQKIPNLKGSILNARARKQFDAYNAAVLLLNFDAVIATTFKDILSVNPTAFNSFDTPVEGFKYTKKVKGLVNNFWLTDNMSSDGVDKIQDKLTHNLVSMIPYYDRKNETNGLFLDMKDLYGLGAALQIFQTKNIIQLSKLDNWESLEENPTRMLMWFLDNIIEAGKKEFIGIVASNANLALQEYIPFKYKVGVAHSLKNFLTSIEDKEYSVNEKTGIKTEGEFSMSRIITQALVNSIGTTYSTDMVGQQSRIYKEMHSHNSERVQLQEGIYTHLKHGITAPEKYYVSNEDLAALLVNEVHGTRTLIKKILGINLSNEAAEDVVKVWTQKVAKIEEDVYVKEVDLEKTRSAKLVGIFTSILKSIFPQYDNPGEKGEKFVGSLFETIAENEASLDEERFSDSNSNNDVITSISKLKVVQDILDKKMDSMIVRILTTISKLGGEPIPTAIIPSLGQNDLSVLRERIRLEKDRSGNESYKNYYASYGNLLGTVIKLEVARNELTKDADKLNIIENYTSHFEYDFIDSFKTDYNSINIMIGNYADKSRIISKRIDKFSKFGLDETNQKFIIGNDKATKDNVYNSDEVWQLSADQSKNYYNDLTKKVVSDFRALATIVPELRTALNKATDRKSELLAINKYLRTVNYEDFLNLINSIDGVDFVEELHYSKYRDENKERVSINQTIFDYHTIYNDPVIFEAFKERQRESFIHKLLGQNENKNILFSANKISKINTIKKVDSPGTFAKIVAELGYDYKQYAKNFENKDGDHVLYIIDEAGKFILNPVVDKWLSVNEFFRNEYLFMTVKAEYMHPAGKALRPKLDIIDTGIDNFLDVFSGESATRLTMMAKRNVSYTGTTELPTRNSRYGVTENVNVAVINDTQKVLANIAGDTDNVKVHDGSSYLSYQYSKMIDNSFQGKGYEGTKKQLGTFVTEFGSALKKDAETVVTNDKIRNSAKSEISFRNKQQQMLGLDVNIKNYDSGTLTTNNTYYKDGDYYGITRYVIVDNSIILYKTKFNELTKEWDALPNTEPQAIHSLFNLWELFGAEDSIDLNFEFNEGSNDLLFNLLVDYEVEGKYPLKDNMIHIISNQSCFKSGAANVHPSSYWTTNAPLKYATLRNKHMGVQLDASHDIVGSKMKEVTQLISALSQNPDTSAQADEMYATLAEMIAQAMEKDLEQISNVTPEKLKKLYASLSKDLVHNLATSETQGLAKTIAETFGYNKVLPVSNQNFFSNFVKNLVTKMNQDFITRYYPGTGAILTPSHGIIMVYENEAGQTFTQGDIRVLAVKDYQKNKYQVPTIDVNGATETRNPTTQEMIDNYVTKNFRDVKINASAAQLEDTVKVVDKDGNTVLIYLNSLDKYYAFKQFYKGQEVLKVHNAVRDLKPIEITFDVTTSKNEELTPEIIKEVKKKVSAKGKLLELLAQESGETELKSAIYFLRETLLLPTIKPETHKKITKLLADAEVIIPEYMKNIDNVSKGMEFEDLIQDIAEQGDSILYEGANQTPSTETKNLFDFAPVQMKFGQKTLIDIDVMAQFNAKFNLIDSIEDTTEAKELNAKNARERDRKLTIWTQRHLQLLDVGRTLKDLVAKDGIIDFDTYFGTDDLTSIIIDDHLDHYLNNEISIPVTNYKKKAAELILGNIYKDDFKIGSASISEIRGEGAGFFREKFEKVYNYKSGIKADFKIATAENEPDVYVVFKPKDRLPAMDKVKTAGKIVSTFGEDGKLIRTRIDLTGNALYVLPEDSVLEISNDGNDILYIEAGKVELVQKEDKKVPRFKVNNNITTVVNKLIKSFDSNIEGIVPIMDNLWQEPDVPSIEFNTKTFSIFAEYSGYNQTTPMNLNPDFFTANREEILTQIANKTFASWEKSHDFVSARIPAQSMQSFMEMRNIGYLNTNSNDSYVSVWQIFIQGSDFDIDKAYVMGHGFNKAGHFELWNDVFTFTSKEALDVLETFPMPTKEKINTILSEQSQGVADISTEFAILTEMLTLEGIDSADFATSVKQNFSPETLRMIKIVLQKTSKQDTISIAFDPNWSAEKINEATIHRNYLVSLLNQYNTSKNYLKNKFSTVNSVVSGIKGIISSASNQIYANKPVDTKALHRGAQQATDIKNAKLEEKSKEILKSGKKLNPEILEAIQKLYKITILNPSKLKTTQEAINAAAKIKKLKETLSPHDMLSMFKQQVDSIIGKTDVGIGANGLKVMFALNNYYNNYYKTLTVEKRTVNNGGVIETVKSMINPDGSIVDVNTDPKWFKKTFNMGKPLGTVTRMAIADVKLNSELIGAIAVGYGLNELTAQLNFILKGEAALYASGFVSGATDNAKELIMAKINAIENLASMHLYLMTMGFTSEEVSLYMNSDLATFIVASINKSNIYDDYDENAKSMSVPNLISQYIEENPDEESIANTFSDIFNGAGEFGNLASILKINQSTSADVQNLFLYLHKFNKSMYVREHEVLQRNLLALQKGYNTDKVIATIIEKHPNTLTPKYVADVLEEASSISVKFINSKGLTEEKMVSMVGGQFDVRFYIHPENVAYRKIAIKYYNLFKNTINIFDVIENSPHFKAMINGLSVTHNKTLITSGKYNFVFNYATDIIRDKSFSLYLNNKDKNTEVKTLFGNAALPIDLGEKEFGRLLRGYDNFLIAAWLKGGDASNYKFNTQDLLKQSGLSSITLYTSDDAKVTPIGPNNLATINVTKESENMQVDLTSDFGIANFKRLMEQIILPIMQRSQKTNLGNQLRTKSVRNPFGLYTTQITALFGLSSLDSEVNLTKYQELLNDFNEVDMKIEKENRIIGADGKPIPFQDLLYIYNLVVNNESFGDNRLTAIFQDYVKNESTIAYDYLNFSTQVDLKNTNIFSIEVGEEITNANEKETVRDKLLDSLMNDIVFVALQTRGQLSLKRIGNNKVQNISVQNPDFIINTFMDVTDNKDLVKYNNFLRLTGLLRDANLLIHFKCD